MKEFRDVLYTVLRLMKEQGRAGWGTLYTQVQSMRRIFTKGSEGGEDRKDK